MQLSSKGIYYGSLDPVLKRIIANDPEHFSSPTRSRKLLSTTSGDIGNPVRTLEKQRARNRKTIPLLRLLTPRFKQNDPKEQWVFFISEQSPFLDDAWAIARNVSKKEAGGRGRNANKHADDHDLQLNRQVHVFELYLLLYLSQEQTTADLNAIVKSRASQCVESTYIYSAKSGAAWTSLFDTNLGVFISICG